MPDWNIRMRRPVGSEPMELGLGRKTTVNFEIIRPTFSFPLAILASAVLEGTRQMLGWVAFYSGYQQDLHYVSPDFLELRETKVDPQFFGKGIGPRLVEMARMLATEQGKPLFLKPMRPGEGLAKQWRDREFPLTTEQITAFYLKHGFRPLTAPERFRFSRAILDAEVTVELFFNCLDPVSLQFTRKKEYAMQPDDPVAAAIRAIPLWQKLELLQKHFEMEAYRWGYANHAADLVRSRIQNAVRNTAGILLSREDLPLPKFRPGPRIFYGRKEPPARLMAGGSHF